MGNKYGFHSARQAGFQKGFTTLDHISSLLTLIEEGRAHGKRIYRCFMNFQKTFEIATHPQLMQCVEAIGILVDMQQGIYEQYESEIGKAFAPNGLSKVVTSNTTFDHYQPLFSLYIDKVYNHIEKISNYIVKVSNYIGRFGGSGACLAEMAIPVLLNADDVLWTSSSLEGLERHLYGYTSMA